MEAAILPVKDPIPNWTAWFRKCVTIRSVSHGIHQGPLTQSEFVAGMSSIHRDAVLSTDIGRKTSAFWKMENLASSFLKNAQPGQSLRDADLPIEIRPIAHCGMGIAAVEVADFKAQRITEVIESFSSPACRLFAYEGSGAMLALYEKDLFGLMSRACRMLGLLPLAALDRPDEREFLADFEPEIQRLIAHGYGRMLYFKHGNIAAAVEAAMTLPSLDASACVQGIAFAYAMVNNGDLQRVFKAGESLNAAEFSPAFENGLIYALEFWEWMAPGFLDQFAPKSTFGSYLTEVARREIEYCRRRGTLSPFIVESRGGSSERRTH